MGELAGLIVEICLLAGGMYCLMALLVLGHELGHARAVIRAGGRPVVIVGKVPSMLSLRLRNLDIHFSFTLIEKDDLFAPVRDLDRPAGVCVHDPTGMTVAQLRSIASAGPRADAISGVILTALALLVGPGSGLFSFLVFGVLIAFLSAIKSLSPSRRVGILPGDGGKLEGMRKFDADFVPIPPTSDPAPPAAIRSPNGDRRSDSEPSP